MILTKLSLLKWCFNRESKKYLCTSDKAGFFSNKTYDSYKCWTCTELSEAFTFLMENIYVQFGDMETFRVLKYLISIFLHYTYPCRMILTKLSLLKWCFNRESKKYLCTSDKAGFFSNKTYDSYKCWTCTELSEAFTFLMENIYVQFGDMVYQQIVGIPMGTNCAPLIVDLFLYCYERDFMSNLQKPKRFDLIDKFNDTSRYLDDIFTIDNSEFAEHIPDINPRELQLSKANASDK